MADDTERLAQPSSSGLLRSLGAARGRGSALPRDRHTQRSDDQADRTSGRHSGATDDTRSGAHRGRAERRGEQPAESRARCASRVWCLRARSFLAKRGQQMTAELSEQAEALEAEARSIEPLPADVVSVSCGMDRMAVRMSEPHSDPENAPAPRRTEPYERTPPEPREHNWRMA
jgi:hypothetical protein